jgi:predicted metalloprotease with PDZ domain
MKKVLLVSMLLLVGIAAVMAEKERGYLGVTIMSVEKKDQPEESGVFIQHVNKSSGAAKAGLMADDRIISVDGREIADYDDLRDALAAYEPGDLVTVLVMRDDEQLQFNVELGEKQKHAAHAIAINNGKWVMELAGERAYLGIHTQELEGQLADYFGVEKGVLVSSVVEDGPAAVAGLKAGDVILAWGGEEITSTGDLHKRLRGNKEGDVADLVVKRRDGQMTIPVTLGKTSDSSWTSYFDGENFLHMPDMNIVLEKAMDGLDSVHLHDILEDIDDEELEEIREKLKDLDIVIDVHKDGKKKVLKIQSEKKKIKEKEEKK